MPKIHIFISVYKITIVTLSILLFTPSANTQSSRQQFIVPTERGEVLVESFGNCENVTCPAVVILSGSKGFGAPVYDEIGQIFRGAGLNGYLVHVLTAADLNTIATSHGARERIAYYAKRLPNWTSAVQSVTTYLERQPRHGGKVGVLGISLGAQIALAATDGRSEDDALLLVDGGLPSGYSQSLRSLPSMLLIWGSADQTFPLSNGRKLRPTARRLGGIVTFEVYEGGAHDFFVRSGSGNADAAHRSAAKFLAKHLSL